MYDTREVTITLRLPHDIADQAEEVQKTDPEFLSRVVLYGLVRRGVYRDIRDRNEAMESDMEARVFTPAEQGRLAALRGAEPISEEEGRRILAENRHHHHYVERPILIRERPGDIVGRVAYVPVSRRT